jgi:hypothetical protein
MDYVSIFAGFVSGVLLALAGAWINITLNNRSADNVALKAAEYEMYLKLNDLYNWYFWYATNELHKIDTPQDIADECHKIAVDLARLLHENEVTEFAEELLKILYDESYETYDQRWKHMSALSEKMGNKVVPVHRQRLSQISESNIHLMAQEKFVAKAPASSRFKMGV